MILRLWYGFWIWLLFALRLRKPFNDLQRRLAGEHKAPRKPLAEVSHPGELREHLKGFDWRRDTFNVGKFRVFADFVSHPQVFEARLADPDTEDGDCDDFGHYAATQLLKMEHVSQAYAVSVGYPGGGHIACVYEFRDVWYLMNYFEITRMDDPLAAGALLMKWAGHTGKKPRWLFFEDVDLKRVRP